MIFCLVIDLGGGPDKDRRGFRYWRDEPFNNGYLGIDPPAKARFLGFWAVLTQASFSYGGMEGLASICLEASNPRKTMYVCKIEPQIRAMSLYMLLSGKPPSVPFSTVSCSSTSSLCSSLVSVFSDPTPICYKPTRKDPVMQPSRLSS